MNLDDKTVQILHNFAGIHKQMLFRSGDTLSTMTEGMSIVARAKVDAPIGREFGIGDLPRFLGVVRLFRNPLVTLGDKNLTLSEGGRSVSYAYSDTKVPGWVISPPTKEINLKADVSFKLPASTLKEIKNAAAVLGYKELFIVGEKGDLRLEVADAANPESDKFSETVGKSDKSFRAVLKMDNLKFIIADYDVDVSFKGMVKFKNPGIEYFVAVESKRSVMP